MCYIYTVKKQTCHTLKYFQTVRGSSRLDIVSRSSGNEFGRRGGEKGTV